MRTTYSLVNIDGWLRLSPWLSLVPVADWQNVRPALGFGATMAPAAVREIKVLLEQGWREVKSTDLNALLILAGGATIRGVRLETRTPGDAMAKKHKGKSKGC